MLTSRYKFTDLKAALAHRDWSKALVIVDDLLGVTPKDASLHYNRGLLLKYLDRLDEALDAFETALRYDPHHAHARFEQGAALFTLGRLKDSIPVFLDYLKTSPDDPDAELNVGLALLRLGQPDEARAHLLNAHELTGSSQAIHALASAERDLGHLDRMETWLARLQKPTPDLAAAMLKVRTQGANGRFALKAVS